MKMFGDLKNWRREVMAGTTTFLTMAYIVVVNPAILSKSGMPMEAVFFATCAASAIATMVMALYARYPFALAPGMGLNAFFAFTVCGELGLSWQTALACVLVSGAVFLVLSVVGIREKLIASVPPELVKAIAAGIGLFIAFIGLTQAGIVVGHPATLVTLGDLRAPATAVAIIGLFVTMGLLAARVPGAVLIGVVATAAIAVAAGVSPPPKGIVQMPGLSSETLGVALTALPNLLRPEVIPVLFTMLFLDLFDTMGTLIALGHASGHMDGQGKFPRVGRAFTADAVGTCVGSLLGTSTVTTYIESASGIVAGGRTGLTALVTACLFLLTLPFFPLVAAVPAIATAPALIAVGAMMFQSAADVEWRDPVVAIPALLTILVMPATFNISNGLGAGFVLFVIANLAAGRFAKIKPPTATVAIMFIAYFTLRMAG